MKRASNSSERTPLTELLDRYIESHDLEKDSPKTARAAIASLSRHLKVPATTEHLDCSALNPWLLKEVSRVSRRTAKNYRAELITLWRWAIEEGETVPDVRGVRRVKVPLQIIEAYTPEEVERLLSACYTLTNKFCSHLRVQRKVLYSAFILASWSTGFRPGDLLRLRWSDVTATGCVRIVQHKTNRRLVRWVDQDTLAALEAIQFENDKLVFGHYMTSESLRAVFPQLKQAAGIKRGTPKWIRRALATAIAARDGEEAAGRALGHATAGLAIKHYIDSSQLDPDQPQPPRLRRFKFKKPETAEANA